MIETIIHPNRLIALIKLQVDNWATAKFLKLTTDRIERIMSRDEDIPAEKKMKGSIRYAKLLFHVQELSNSAEDNGHYRQAKLWRSFAGCLKNYRVSIHSRNIPFGLSMTGITSFLQAKVEEAKDKQDSVKIQKFWNETLQQWQENQFIWLEQAVITCHILRILQDIEANMEKITYTIDWMKFGKRKASQAAEKGDSILRSRWLKVSRKLERLLKGKGYAWEMQMLKGLVCQERGERAGAVFGRLWLAAAEALFMKAETGEATGRSRDSPYSSPIYSRKDKDEYQDMIGYETEDDEQERGEEVDESNTLRKPFRNHFSVFIECLMTAESKLHILKYVPLSNPGYDNPNNPAPRQTKFATTYSKIKKLFADGFTELIYLFVTGKDGSSFDPSSSAETMEKAIKDRCDNYMMEKVEASWETYQEHVPKNDPSQWLIEIDRFYESHGRECCFLRTFEERLPEYYLIWSEYVTLRKKEIAANVTSQSENLLKKLKHPEVFARECLIFAQSLQKLVKLNEIPELTPAVLLDYGRQMMHRLVTAYPKAPPIESKVEGQVFNRLLATVLTEKTPSLMKITIKLLVQLQSWTTTPSDNQHERDSLQRKAWSAAKLVFCRIPETESEWDWNNYLNKRYSNSEEIITSFFSCIDLADNNLDLAALHYQSGYYRMLSNDQSFCIPLYSAYQKAITCYEQRDMEGYEMERLYIQLFRLLTEKTKRSQLSQPVLINYILLKDIKDTLDSNDDARSSQQEWMAVVKLALENTSVFTSVTKDDAVNPGMLEKWQRIVDYCKAHQEVQK